MQPCNPQERPHSTTVTSSKADSWTQTARPHQKNSRVAAEKSLKVAKSHVGRFASAMLVPRKVVFGNLFFFLLVFFFFLSVHFCVASQSVARLGFMSQGWAADRLASPDVFLGFHGCVPLKPHGAQCGQLNICRGSCRAPRFGHQQLRVSGFTRITVAKQSQCLWHFQENNIDPPKSFSA